MQEFGVGWIPRWALARPGPWGNQCEKMEGLMRAYVMVAVKSKQVREGKEAGGADRLGPWAGDKGHRVVTAEEI